jgi:hypothetical protein
MNCRMQSRHRQATEMRMRAGYRIEKDKSEEELESRFHKSVMMNLSKMEA